jgi:hypothetical protein
MFNTPVLFLIFNRPDTTRLVFEAIREIKPKQLFVAADGPRANRAGEGLLCAGVKEYVIENIDWDCDVKTLFRSENLGCGKAVSSAISWFFEHVEEGIILEDDCLPDPSFFPFCAELLEHHRSNFKVMSISGSNLLGSYTKQNDSYLWSWGGVWGWATWKRAWKLYEFSLEDWGRDETKLKIEKLILSKSWFDFYYLMFEQCYRKELDTWDVQWFYCILKNNGISINPTTNLVANIGFSENATHTFDSNNYLAKLKSNEIHFPLIHPSKEIIDIDYLEKVMEALRPANEEKIKTNQS